jgi:hypothetical protein
VIGSQVIPAEIEQLAEDVSRAIMDDSDRFAMTEGEVAFVAYREGRRFGRLTLKSTVVLVPSQRRFSDVQIQRLAADARAKILSEAASIAASVGPVTIRVHARGQGYTITVGFER